MYILLLLFISLYYILPIETQYKLCKYEQFQIEMIESVSVDR